MLYQRVSSSCIAVVGYDLSDKTLAVRFHGGTEYRYTGVPLETYQALLAADSIGKYFNADVRDTYPHQRAQ
jgi:hypothetical protein